MNYADAVAAQYSAMLKRHAAKTLRLILAGVAIGYVVGSAVTAWLLYWNNFLRIPT